MFVVAIEVLLHGSVRSPKASKAFFFWVNPLNIIGTGFMDTGHLKANVNGMKLSMGQ